ncbi:unnamed protein product [Urochloa humidicola]
MARPVHLANAKHTSRSPMASTAKIAVVLVAALALPQVSSAAARRHGKAPDPPCDAATTDEANNMDDLLATGGMRHKKAPPHHHCAPARHGGGGGGTPAVMTVNGFRRGEDGGGPSACDGHFHGDGELVVALSTEWFARGRRCHRAIRITSAHDHGRTVEARVVDECDSRRGCRHNIVDSSPAVWRALGLDTNVGEVPITWSDA